RSAAAAPAVDTLTSSQSAPESSVTLLCYIRNIRVAPTGAGRAPQSAHSEPGCLPGELALPDDRPGPLGRQHLGGPGGAPLGRRRSSWRMPDRLRYTA